MNQDKYVFTQITDFLNWSKFNRIVAKYNGDRYVLSVSLTAKMHLRDLLGKTNFQNVKDPSDSSEPLLFNF